MEKQTHMVQFHFLRKRRNKGDCAFKHTVGAVNFTSTEGVHGGQIGGAKQ